MSHQREHPYEFGPDAPVGAVDPGTTLLVAGPEMSSAHTLGLRLVLAGGADEGHILVATEGDSADLVAVCEDLNRGATERGMTVVDATGRGAGDLPVDCRRVSGATDLAGIGLEFSALYEELYSGGTRRIRSGLFSVTALLDAVNLRDAFRFLNTVGGRVTAADGLGVFVLDPTAHDDETVGTVAQVFDGRIDVRDGEAGPELRVEGVDVDPGEWTQF